MTRPLRLATFVLLATIPLLTTGTAEAGRAAFEARLRQAIDSGAVEARRADLYRLWRLRDQGHLPAVLRDTAAPVAVRAAESPNPSRRPERDGTGELRALRKRLADAPADLQAEAAPYLTPPAAAHDAAPPARSSGKSGGRTLQNRVTTANFSVEWGSTLTNEDGTSPAADTGPAFAGDPAVGGNGVPDVVERWAAYLEASWRVLIDELGFVQDILATRLVPVYLGNSDPTTAIDDIASGALFGFTDYTGNGSPYLVMNNDFDTLLGITSIAAAQPSLKITAAHELFHVLHFLYEPQLEGFLWEDEIWWWEASATWLEDEVFDSVDDYQTWLQAPGAWADFVEAGLAVNYSDPHYATRAYGGVIFAKYLQEHVGGRDSIRQVWERIRPGGTSVRGRRVLDAFENYAVSRGFTDLPHLFLGFAGANAVMDYEEGVEFGAVPLRGSTVTAAHVATGLPANLGATYRREGAPPWPSGQIGGRRVQVVGAPAVPWGLSAVVARSDGASLVLGSTDAVGTPGVSLAGLTSSDGLWAVVSYFSPTDADPSAPPRTATGGGGGGGGCFVNQLDRAARALAAPSQEYSVVLSNETTSDTTPPAPVGGLSVGSVPGGFNLTWTASPDPDVAGYVVRWESAAGTGWRTLFGPVNQVEVRGLAPRRYTVTVYAYDEFGNAGFSAGAPVTVSVSQSGSDTQTPGAL